MADWSDRPELTAYDPTEAAELIEPSAITLIETALETKWVKKHFRRAVNVYVPNAKRLIRGVNVQPRGNEVTRSLYVSGAEGVLRCAPGWWWLNLGIFTVEGTEVEAVYQDAAFAIYGPGGTSDAIPGVTMLGPQSGSVAASALKIAARSNRKYLEIENQHATLELRVGWGQAAEALKGCVVEPGTFRVWHGDMCPTQDVYLRSQDGATSVAFAYQEGV